MIKIIWYVVFTASFIVLSANPTFAKDEAKNEDKLKAARRNLCFTAALDVMSMMRYYELVNDLDETYKVFVADHKTTEFSVIVEKAFNYLKDNNSVGKRSLAESSLYACIKPASALSFEVVHRCFTYPYLYSELYFERQSGVSKGDLLPRYVNNETPQESVRVFKDTLDVVYKFESIEDMVLNGLQMYVACSERELIKID